MRGEKAMGRSTTRGGRKGLRRRLVRQGRENGGDAGRGRTVRVYSSARERFNFLAGNNEREARNRTIRMGFHRKANGRSGLLAVPQWGPLKEGGDQRVTKKRKN